MLEQKNFYVLISRRSLQHYGFSFDEQTACEKAYNLEKELGEYVDVYEFRPYDEINKLK